MVKNFNIIDLDKLQKEFYRSYDPDYWLYRIMLLKNSHDNFEQLKDVLAKNTEETVDGDFKRVIRTELHFLYFQMVETLFEIIFATKHDNRDLWMALTFSNDKNTAFYSDNYKRIAELNELSDIFTEEIKTDEGSNEVAVPLLRWIFYFIYPTKLSDDEWETNLENIKDLLLIFSRDFKDRGEYNAYKHSLRFYNKPLSMSIGISGGKMHSLGSSEDCIVFLEEQKKMIDGKMISTEKVSKTSKPFDFQRDYDLCILIYTMIKNIICTRKYTLLEELHGKDFPLANFVNLSAFKITTPRTGIIKSSFTV